LEAPNESFYTVVLPSGSDALVDVEEHRERSMTRPALTDDGVDAFTKPP
jgi:hypothetical protein